MEAPLIRLVEGGLHDLGRDPLYLDVHLERGDPVLGPGDLEVHVAQVVLQSHDVAQDAYLSPSMTRPMAMPATAALRGTPALNSESDAEHTDAMDDEPFDSRISETCRMV